MDAIRVFNFANFTEEKQTKFKLENVSIANALQLEAARRLSALIRRPCQVWSRSAYPLPS